MSTAARGMLPGAASRLLPASIPFRFFGAAVAFHLLAWMALAAGADAVPRFSGGLGWLLAALHLVTLGVLAMTAIGASLQLLPVATRRPVAAPGWPAAIWLLYTPGVAALAIGMGTGAPVLLAAGAIAVVLGLAAWAALMARNLIRSKGMPAVTVHCWIALASLAVALATAVSAAGAYVGGPSLERGTTLAMHVVFAAYGFMGMLALGLSYILVPMFAVSVAPPDRRALASAGLAAVALLVAGAAGFGLAPVPLRLAAIATGAVAVALHIGSMTTTLASGMRRELGRSFRLVRISWGLLVASLGGAFAVTLGVPFEGTAALFGIVLIGGWLLTFLLGLLQRIVPFLASMHAASGAAGAPRRLPTPSSLTAEGPLAIHFACHLAALALLALATLAGSAPIARAGALAGLAGAAAFAWFFVVALRRAARHRRNAPIA